MNKSGSESLLTDAPHNFDQDTFNMNPKYPRSGCSLTFGTHRKVKTYSRSEMLCGGYYLPLIIEYSLSNDTIEKAYLSCNRVLYGKVADDVRKEIVQFSVSFAYMMKKHESKFIPFAVGVTKNKKMQEYTEQSKKIRLPENIEFGSVSNEGEEKMEEIEKDDFLEEFKEVVNGFLIKEIENYAGNNPDYRRHLGKIFAEVIGNNKKLPVVAKELGLNYKKTRNAYYPALERLLDYVINHYKPQLDNNTAPDLIQQFYNNWLMKSQ